MYDSKLTSGSSSGGAQNGHGRHPAMDLLGDERLEDRGRVGVDAGCQVLRGRLGFLESLHAQIEISLFPSLSPPG